MNENQINIVAFEQVEIRVGRIVQIEPFPEGRYSSHVLQIDFGDELGTRKSLARLIPNYADEDLTGRQVLCVVNLPPRQIGKHLSEVLTLGVPDKQGNVVLLRPDRNVPLGGKLY
jgi:tRNA-binding protein